MNHLQNKLLEQCNNRNMSVVETFETMKAQRDLCKKMVAHMDEVFSRRVWKKSVMTVSSYGATQLTSRADILFQLKTMESSFLYSCTPSELTMFTNMCFWSLESGVPSAMRFLKAFRRLFTFILRYRDEITFTNPLTGFPVCLRKNKDEIHDFTYSVHGHKRSSRIKRELNITNKRKTVTSSVPSVIHSVDGAILSMIKEGLGDTPMSFIHDSVGVHPNNLIKAKESVCAALNTAMNADVYQRIVDELLVGLEEHLKGDLCELATAPSENTWDLDSNTPLIEQWYYAFS